MWNQWKLKKVFHDRALDEVERAFDNHLSPSERTAALNRPSATAVSGSTSTSSTSTTVTGDVSLDPRKRSAPSNSPIPHGEDGHVAKRAMLQDPRQAPTTAAPSQQPMSVELMTLQSIINAPEIIARQDLQGVIQDIKRDISQNVPAAQMKSIIAECVKKLQSAILGAPPPPPAPLQISAMVPPPPPPSIPMTMPGNGLSYLTPSSHLPPPPLHSVSIPPPSAPMTSFPPALATWAADAGMMKTQSHQQLPVPPPQTARQMAQAEV